MNKLYKHEPKGASPFEDAPPPSRPEHDPAPPSGRGPWFRKNRNGLLVWVGLALIPTYMAYAALNDASSPVWFVLVGVVITLAIGGVVLVGVTYLLRLHRSLQPHAAASSPSPSDDPDPPEFLKVSRMPVPPREPRRKPRRREEAPPP